MNSTCTQGNVLKWCLSSFRLLIYKVSWMHHKILGDFEQIQISSMLFLKMITYLHTCIEAIEIQPHNCNI